VNEAYGAFAYAYDQSLGRHFFQALRGQLEHALDAYPARRNTHLDVACGTGLAIEFFESRGFRSTGVDASEPMLRVARQRARRLVCADMRALPLRTTFARITSLYDSLNHMMSRDDLVAAFRGIRSVMDADSLFFFDMNHPEIYPEVWGMREPYVSDGPDHHLEIATQFVKRDCLGRGLVTGWAERGGRRVRIRERHEQRAWSEREIAECLHDARLMPVEVLDFDPFQEMGQVRAAAVKLFFICTAA
jgi:SAM-dependent methyltransferase